MKPAFLFILSINTFLTAGVYAQGSTGGVGIGTATPNGRLVVTQTGTTDVDTAAAIQAFTNSALSNSRGAISGTYNTSFPGVGVQGIGIFGVPFANASGSFPDFPGNAHVGLYGSANSAGIIGTSANGYGVRGFSNNFAVMGNSGYVGVWGKGASFGVYGDASGTSGQNYGIYGSTASTGGYAGYFTGRVHVGGSLSKSAGTFKIDHPLDPENKYLYHSFVESPDMMNIYNGNIITDAQGYATVELPGYFDALNKEFRYQLTVIGTFAQAIIKEEINGNSFKIQTSEPSVKVSWMVTGVRKDKYAEANRIIPEVEKEKENKGRYLNAKEWGQPMEKGINPGINKQ